MEGTTARLFFKASFLKFFRFSSNKGLTLMETLIVVTLIAILAGIIYASADYLTQIKKGKDSKRKTDLAILKTKMEDYYNDHNRFPTEEEMSDCRKALPPYLNLIPCDPKGKPYYYETNENGQWFRIYTRLEYEKDPVIASLGCSFGCGPNGLYNYGVSSNNISLETGTGISGQPPCEGGLPADCGSLDLCGQKGPCCPGMNYVLTCVENNYWCCPTEN